ncbi:amidohydrolase [Natronobacillus azotifigens]|uniref:Amidohydrolase n=1 Tax=Natronobacillus azotifigens TaxID=472978 RepID=A0A9J6R7U0_9BACI|nr:amidohydrolase [Natronobacillus azotifigens]MCZ0701704.1 amidohydrolase [Natronobacillus azotifigens]
MEIKDKNDLIAQITKEINQQDQEVIQWRRYLHQHPELSFQETETALFIVNKMEEFGFDIQTNIGGNGIIATLTGGKPGKSIAFRADFDALPIQDEKDVPYRSQHPGIMHACGHDGHTAALLGFAKVLIKYQAEMNGNVVFIFQPAEETPPGGAKAMLQANDEFQKIDYAFAAHLASDLPVGQLALGSGYRMAAVDKFAITIKGRGGHGARPQDANDPIVIGSDMVNALQKIVSRRIDPLASAVVTIGVFQSGNAFNVIPDSAKLEGTVRSFNQEIRNQVEENIRAIVNGIATAYDANVEIEYLRGYPALYNDPQVTKQVEKQFTEGFDQHNVVEFEPMMGAEDFSYFLEAIPGTYFRVGSQNESPSTSYPHHHPLFDMDERALKNIQLAFLAIASAYVF